VKQLTYGALITAAIYPAQQFFAESHTTCILWHSLFDVQLEAFPVLSIAPDNFYFDKDIYDYEARRFELDSNGIYSNDWILKLTVAIEQSKCESFIAFQEDIPKFAYYFYNASTYSIWRSTRNRFIFLYTDELLEQSTAVEDYISGYIFHDQPNILLVNAKHLNSSVFDIKTNRFVGSGRYFGTAPKPAVFDSIQQFDAKLGKLVWKSDMNWKHKLKNLQGREVVVGVFDYKPFMLLSYSKLNASKAFADGTEVRVMLTFCEIYNCSIEVDNCQNQCEWGDVYANATGFGLMGMVLDRRNDYGIGGMYIWYGAYQYMEVTTFLGRSGVTCLVPAPQRIISWALPLRPFRVNLWLCVISYLLLECLALAGARRCEQSLSRSAITGSNWRQSLRFGFVSSIKLVINQSTNYVTSSYTLRTLLLANFGVSLILTSVYGGGLAAILTLPTLEEVADSRQRLYEHKLTWTGTSPAWIFTFNAADVDPALQGIIAHYQVNDAEAIAKKALTEEIGFVVERMTFDHLANAELIPDEALSRLKLMVDDIYFAYTVAYVPRLWPFLEAHNEFILAWHSSGLDKYWEWKITADYMNAHRQNRIAASQKPSLDRGPVQLGIHNFIGAILIWSFGMLCSVIVYLVEIWNFK
ncbi:Ir76a, partial [Drosophila busckii]